MAGSDAERPSSDEINTAFDSDSIDAIKEPKHPFGDNASKICSTHELVMKSERLSRTRRDVSIRLALISMPKIDDELRPYEQTVARDGSSEAEERCYRRRIYNLPQKRDEEYEALYCNALARAVNEGGAHVVCVNEIGFPVVDGRMSKKAAETARGLACTKDKECLIVAGTAHNPATLHNTTRVFYPGCDRADGDYYHKHTSAWWLEHMDTMKGTIYTGERVTVPTRRLVPVAHMSMFRIAWITCSDILDYTSIAAAAQYRVNLLLVPCYTPFDTRIRTAARDISGILPGIVALVNRRSGDEFPSLVYRNGEEDVLKPAEDWDENSKKLHTQIFELDPAAVASPHAPPPPEWRLRRRWLFSIPWVHLAPPPAPASSTASDP